MAAQPNRKSETTPWDNDQDLASSVSQILQSVGIDRGQLVSEDDDGLVGRMEQTTAQAHQGFINSRLEQFEKCLHVLFKILTDTFGHRSDICTTIDGCRNVLRSGGKTRHRKQMLEIAAEWRSSFKPFMMKVMRKQMTLEDVKQLCANNATFRVLKFDELWPELVARSASVERSSTTVDGAQPSKTASPMSYLYTAVHLANRCSYMIHRVSHPKVEEVRSSVFSTADSHSSGGLGPAAFAPLIQELYGAPNTSGITAHMPIMTILVTNFVDTYEAVKKESPNGPSARELFAEISPLIAMFTLMGCDADELNHFIASLIPTPLISELGYDPGWALYLSDDEDDTGVTSSVMSAEAMDDLCYN